MNVRVFNLSLEDLCYVLRRAYCCEIVGDGSGSDRLEASNRGKIVVVYTKAEEKGPEGAALT
jgi:hypothetical protein